MRIMLEYITYHGALTINLSFWLCWFLDMVSVGRDNSSHNIIMAHSCGHMKPVGSHVKSVDLHIHLVKFIISQNHMLVGRLVHNILFYLCGILSHMWSISNTSPHMMPYKRTNSTKSLSLWLRPQNILYTLTHNFHELQPLWFDLDPNQHVNNAKYISWILEVIKHRFSYIDNQQTYILLHFRFESLELFDLKCSKMRE